MKIKLILRVDHPVLGHTGDVIEVASGFARNSLIPQNLAFPYSEDAIRRIEKKKAEAGAVRSEMLKDMETLAKRLAGLELNFVENVSAAGHLYGAVTAKRISEEIAAAGIEIPEAHIRLAEPIRVIGEFEVPVHVHSELNASVKVWVVAKEEPKPVGEGEGEGGETPTEA
ncbi:MAG: 50S ribosomal protein L9 [Planctomycetota bacterium]|nr:50S ribosomal protein L9 [Planctomycetota bacterium]MDA1114073.1 50S ribosomal protein L9 [Planctomycetota bacterium]